MIEQNYVMSEIGTGFGIHFVSNIEEGCCHQLAKMPHAINCRKNLQ
jgi:hypothetical protein